MTEKTRGDFRETFDRIAWGGLSLIALYAARSLNDMGKNIADLNTNFAVMINNVANQTEQIKSVQKNSDDLSLRVSQLENSIYVGRRPDSRAQRKLLSE